MDIAVTAGEAKSQDFSDVLVGANDRIVAFIKINGLVVLRKASAIEGGSADEIEIIPETKFTLKLTAQDTASLPSTSVTYAVYKNGTSVATGGVTVTESTVELTYYKYEVKTYCQKKNFTEDGDMPITIQANSIITQILYAATDVGGSTEQIGIAWTDNFTGEDITVGSSLANDGYSHPLVFVEGRNTTLNPDIIHVVNNNWDGVSVDVTVVWQVLPV